MTRILCRYNLEFEIAYKFVEYSLDDVNILSKEILASFGKRGKFYAMLPEDANLNQLNNFSSYGIIPQNPTQTYISNGH